MKAQLLTSAPVTGICPERWYGMEAKGSWVIFEDQNHINWIGAFKHGSMSHFSTVLIFDTTDAALVIANGSGYVVNINSRELLYRIESDALMDAVAIPGRDLIIVSDCFVSLRALTSAGEVWQSGRISMDGIRFKEVSHNQIGGQVWQLDGWHPFTLHFDDWLFTREISQENIQHR